MVSDTNTENRKNKKDFAALAPLPLVDRSGSLTLRILAVNLIVPFVLILGVLHLGQYRNSLIQAETKTLEVQAAMFAGALAEGAFQREDSQMLDTALAGRLTRRLANELDGHALLFDVKGTLIEGYEASLVMQDRGLEKPKQWVLDFDVSSVLSYIGDNLLNLIPMQTELKPYQFVSSDEIRAFPDAVMAARGYTSATAWETDDGKIIMTAAAPVKTEERIDGVIMLVKRGLTIEQGMERVRFDVLTIFLGILSVTIFLSIYLAGVIGRPLRNLADAAEEIRAGKTRQINIPDLRHRDDEIGELSQALYDMTQALNDRMDAIGHFAADVAHELKNPLTSLRSAVETAGKVKEPEKQARLMEIILDDVRRLDRLITDISRASRLDADLSREEKHDFNLLDLLENIREQYQAPLDRLSDSPAKNNARLLFEIPQDYKMIMIYGNEGRLAQVFENLISNGLSFSKPGQPVVLRVIPEPGSVRVVVENEGPGIPKAKMEEIFERFYSERPDHEGYGRHSGLGLSIARQIVNAHSGQIYAENVKDSKTGEITGVAFTVALHAGEVVRQ